MVEDLIYRMNKMRILITGSSGFIGSYLKKALPEAVGLDRLSAPTTDIVNDVCIVKSETEFDTIFHLAAITDYDEFMSNPEEAYRVNLFGTINLLKQHPNAYFIFASTVGVSTKDWSNPYILSKAIAEQAVKLMANNYLILRFQNVYGLGGNSVISKWLNSRKITIYGNGEQRRDFVYIDDLIKYLTKLTSHEETQCIGTGKLTTINELATILTRIYGDMTITYEKARKGDPDHPGSPANIICQTSLEDGIKNMFSKKSR